MVRGDVAAVRCMLACAACGKGISFRFHCFPEAVAPRGTFSRLCPNFIKALARRNEVLVDTSLCSMLQSPPLLEALLQRVRREYQEMPRLRLTSSQAQRLFGLEPLACAAILGALVKEKFLFCTRDGLLVRSEPQAPAFAAPRI